LTGKKHRRGEGKGALATLTQTKQEGKPQKGHGTGAKRAPVTMKQKKMEKPKQGIAEKR